MSKNNKNGFTLVELLAVIVLLAVLAVIAYTTISGVIKTAKKNAYLTSVKNFVKEVKDRIQRNNIGIPGNETVVCDDNEDTKKCSTVYGTSSEDYVFSVKKRNNSYDINVEPKVKGKFSDVSLESSDKTNAMTLSYSGETNKQSAIALSLSSTGQENKQIDFSTDDNSLTNKQNEIINNVLNHMENVLYNFADCYKKAKDNNEDVKDCKTKDMDGNVYKFNIYQKSNVENKCSKEIDFNDNSKKLFLDRLTDDNVKCKSFVATNSTTKTKENVQIYNNRIYIYGNKNSNNNNVIQNINNVFEIKKDDINEKEYMALQYTDGYVYLKDSLYKKSVKEIIDGKEVNVNYENYFKIESYYSRKYDLCTNKNNENNLICYNTGELRLYLNKLN